MADLPLKPLVNYPSVWPGQEKPVEEELRQLFAKLYRDFVKAQADTVNLYGVPHLGDLSLVERNVTMDGLTVLRQNDDDALRYLFKAWRHRNPRRGLHFLRCYLQVLFGSIFEISQLYQLRAGTYPQDLASLSEIQRAGSSTDDYFLTSRVRVDVNTDIIPERVLKALLTTVSWRFVLNVRVARQLKEPLGVASVFRGCTIMRTSGAATAVRPELYLRASMGVPSATRGANLVFVTHLAEVRTPDDATPPAGAVTVNGQLLLQDGQYVTT